MDNYRLIFFCQRCRKEHDRTHSPMFETGVQCDCGGYIITPSGRGNIQVQMTANVFLIENNDYIAWIGAINGEEAREHFTKNFGNNIIHIEKLTSQETEESKFAFDPKGTGIEEDFVWLTAKEALIVGAQLPMVIYGIEQSVFQEAKRRREEGEL